MKCHSCQAEISLSNNEALKELRSIFCQLEPVGDDDEDLCKRGMELVELLLGE